MMLFLSRSQETIPKSNYVHTLVSTAFVDCWLTAEPEGIQESMEYLWGTFGVLLEYFWSTFGALLEYFLDNLEYFWNTFGYFWSTLHLHGMIL